MSDNIQDRVRTPIDSLTRRGGLRVRASGLCSEIAGDSEQLGLLLDVSELGLRLERPHTPSNTLRGLPRERVVQLEFEHPAVDELIWAKGLIRFDKLEPMRESSGIVRVCRTSGVEIVAAAGRHLRLLRDFVFDLRATAIRSTMPKAPPDFDGMAYWPSWQGS